MSTTSDIADAVVTYLNGLALGVTAERKNTWHDYREADSALHVIVVPVESGITDETRGDFRRQVRIIVIIQQKLQGTISEQQRRDREDTLINLSEDIEEALYATPMGTFSFLDIDGQGPRILIDSANYAQSGIFRTQVELNYVGDM